MGKIYVHEDFEARFVNPYNFIPLGEKCQREKPEIDENDCYTGYFECSMKLLTPLFIPNTSSSVRLLQKEEAEEGEKTGKKYAGYDFFSYEDYSNEEPYQDKMPLPPSAPVIPGSELRGAIRSVYEAAFNGCMSTVDGNRDLSRRCAEIKNPGVLYWDKEQKAWYLKKCSKVRMRVEQPVEETNDSGILLKRDDFDKLEEGEKIYFKKDDNYKVTEYKLDKNLGKQTPPKGFKTGYLHKGEYIKDKKYESIFFETDNDKKNDPIPVLVEDIELFKKVWTEYRNEKKNGKEKERDWYKDFELKTDGAWNFVYYSMDDNGHIYLWPACIGRESFRKKIENLLKNNGGYQPSSDENLCPACQIFGMLDKTEKSGTYAYGSKVRITDATLIHPVRNSSSLFEKPIVLPEMGEPRPSAVEFYTISPYEENEKRKKQGYWTYDYKCQKGARNRDDRINLNQNQPRLRGRKYYWHSAVDLKKFEENRVSAMQQRIRPLKPSDKSGMRSTFRFRVYFEQLNKRQLEQLKWSLDFGDPNCAHKIGRGKPLGFGSVQINVESLCIRNIDEETGKWEIISIGEHGEESYGEFFGVSDFSIEEIPEELKIMANWEKKPENVCYPQGEDESDAGKVNGNASHQWFRLNKTKRDQLNSLGDTSIDNFRHNFSKVLPTVQEDADEKLKKEKALYRLVEKEKEDKTKKFGANVKRT